MSRSKADLLTRTTMNNQGIESEQFKTIGGYVEKKATKVPINNEERSSDVPTNQAVSRTLQSIMSSARKHSLSSELDSLSKSIVETQSPSGIEKIRKVNKTKNKLKKRKKEQYIAEEWITLPNASQQYKPRSKVLKKRDKKHIREECIKKEVTQYISKKKPTHKGTSRDSNNHVGTEERDVGHSLDPLQPQFSKRKKVELPAPLLKRKRNLKSDSFLTRKASPLPKTSKPIKKTSFLLKSVTNTSKKDEKEVVGFADPEKFFQALKVLAKKKRQYHHLEIVIPGSGDERNRGKKRADYLAYQSKLRSGVLISKSRRKQSGVRPKQRSRKPITNLRECSFSTFTGTPITAVEYYSKSSTP